MAPRLLRSVLLLALLAGPAWGEDDPLSFQDRVVAVVRSAEGPRTITVIRLHHAKAEELAVTLEGLLPRSVTVVPDVPTNSLIVSLPAAPPVVPIEPVR